MHLLCEAIVFGPPSKNPNCRLLRECRTAPGIDAATHWEAWDAATTELSDGVFVVVGDGRSTKDAIALRTWLLALLTASLSRIEIRGWPILLLSPYADTWLRGLRRLSGLDLALMPGTLVGSVSNDVKVDNDYCECDAICRETTRLLTRLSLRRRRPCLEVRDSITTSNLRQAVSVLNNEAELLHADIHGLRDARVPLATAAKPTPTQRLSGLSRTLDLLVLPARVLSFVEEGERRIRSEAAGEAQAATAATYLEEVAATLQLHDTVTRVMKHPQTTVFVVDDDPLIVGAIREKLQGEMVVIALNLRVTDITKALSRARETGIDPSVVVGDMVMGCLNEALLPVQARTRWLRDATQCVLVADIRLNPDAPDAGMWVLRRARDSYPFLRTIAVTVRRGLADALSDEAVDAYVLKASTVADTAEAVGSVVRRITEAGSYVLLPGTEGLDKDVAFLQVVQKKYRLRLDTTGSRGARLVIARLEDLATAKELVATDGVLAAVIPADVEPQQSFDRISAFRKTGCRHVVVMRRDHVDRASPRVLSSSLVALDQSLAARGIVKHDVRWTMLVPRWESWGGMAVLAEESAATALGSSIASRFGGATTKQATGLWVRPSDRFVVRDDLDAVEVWARWSQGGRQQVDALANRISRRCGQDEIYVVEETITTLSVVPEEVLETGLATDLNGRLDVVLSDVPTREEQHQDEPHHVDLPF